MKVLSYIATLILLLFSVVTLANTAQTWQVFVAKLRAEAMADGIKPEVFNAAFRNIFAPSPSVLHFDKAQPEKRLNFLEYRNTRVDHYRISLGRQEFKRNQNVLQNISNQYGVSACFIVAIWGLETSYGHFKGNFPVIQSLATLAYNSRRGDFFRNELRIALHMLNDGKVSLSEFKGEWAGASGHCQFMPSTWSKYAVDYDHQGRADIWNNVNDAFASIGNFLAQNGWHRDEPWAIQVNLPENFNHELLSINITKTVSEWLQLGVKPIRGYLPDKNWQASVIFPNGGPGLMVFDNFKTLLKWNRSDYYVGALGYLAEEICQKKL